MSYCTIRWVTYDERNLLKNLSNLIYRNSKVTYPINLNASSSNLFDLFLLPPHILGSNERKVVGVFDQSNQLIAAVGTRQVQAIPAWLLSWTVSSINSYAFMNQWKNILTFLTSYYEGINCNEFYVINPCDREESYRRIMRFMRTRYWTFVERQVLAGSVCENSLHNAFMGYTTYPYNINIRRYILKRQPDE